jgi:hypothetical protein
MATAQTSKSGTSNRTKKTQGSSQRSTSSQTGERDENYNLISVLYHALQGADTISQYQKDAQSNDDDELIQFFEETRASYVLVAQQAKQLLATRIDVDEDDDSDDEDDSDE